MNKRKLVAALLTSSFLAGIANASTQHFGGLTIEKIRSVGNYHSGSTFDDTIELWFDRSLTWSSNMNCTTSYRVYVDASKTHMVSAAYMAFASGKKVGINADDSLPIRSDSCEISYIDVEL